MTTRNTVYIFLNNEFDQSFAVEGLNDAITKIKEICPAAEFTTICDIAAEGHDKASGHEFLILLQSAE